MIQLKTAPLEYKTTPADKASAAVLDAEILNAAVEMAAAQRKIDELEAEIVKFQKRVEFHQAWLDFLFAHFLE